MPGVSAPRQRLEESVARRLVDHGYGSRGAVVTARSAVDAFYRHDVNHHHAPLVAAAAYELITESIPPLASHMRSAFEGVRVAAENVARMFTQFDHYSTMMEREKLDKTVEDLMPQYDASGLPVNVGPYAPSSVDPNRNVPCVEEGCNNEVPPGGAAYCGDCLGLNPLPPAPRFEPYSGPHSPGPMLQVSFDDGASWSDLSGVVSSVELHDGGGFGPDYEDAEPCREYPTDRITGAPHHYIVNGDHDACGCGGHLVECCTHDDPQWRHAPSICGVTRTLCNHSPRHFYREPCEDYAASLPAISQVRELHRSLRVYDAEDGDGRQWSG
jgi:hypothetical protein